jgi:hypothetical protein
VPSERRAQTLDVWRSDYRVKIKNAHYTQAIGRHELFERRTATGARARSRRPVLVA